jgi:predicted Zn-dependent protease
MQLQLSLESLVSTNKKVVLDHAAADRAFAISKTASPNHPALLVARSQYLLNSGRWKESNELRFLTQRLEKLNPGYPQSWMVVALYHGLHGKPDVAGKALMNGIATGGSVKDMQHVAGLINLEIVDADAENIRR